MNRDSGGDYIMRFAHDKEKDPHSPVKSGKNPYMSIADTHVKPTCVSVIRK